MSRLNIELKKRLWMQGISQRALSRKTHIPEAVISMAVNGRYNLDADQKRSIADALNCQPLDIFQRSNN